MKDLIKLIKECGALWLTATAALIALLCIYLHMCNVNLLVIIWIALTNVLVALAIKMIIDEENEDKKE